MASTLVSISSALGPLRVKQASHLVCCLLVLAVFGRVIEGMDVVSYIEKVPKGPMDKPVDAVTVKKSGELKDGADSAAKVKDEL